VSEQPALFGDEVASIGLRDKVSTARRQRATLARGFHPISGYPLHEQAAPIDDRTAEGLRCRNCFFAGRAIHADVFKCSLDSGAHITHGEATDLRLWFPACSAHVAASPLSEGDKS